ncbi:MAG TPA: septation protein IspZ [Rhizomicrobium sp.]|nr:septation protein IspZ [Rhizomicrobium sp.]
MGFLRAFRPILLDLLATIVFIGILWATDNTVLATLSGVAAGLARFAWMKFRGQPVGPLQYVSVVLVIVSGTATILTQNLLFMQIKSSLVAGAVAIVMLTTNWMAPYLPPIVTENIAPRVIRWTSLGWGALVLGLAVANAVIALTLSREFWMAYTAVVPAVVQVGAFVVQYVVFRALVGRSIRARLASEAVLSTTG